MTTIILARLAQDKIYRAIKIYPLTVYSDLLREITRVLDIPSHHSIKSIELHENEEIMLINSDDAIRLLVDKSKLVVSIEASCIEQSDEYRVYETYLSKFTVKDLIYQLAKKGVTLPEKTKKSEYITNILKVFSDEELEGFHTIPKTYCPNIRWLTPKELSPDGPFSTSDFPNPLFIDDINPYAIVTGYPPEVTSVRLDLEASLNDESLIMKDYLDNNVANKETIDGIEGFSFRQLTYIKEAYDESSRKHFPINLHFRFFSGQDELSYLNQRVSNIIIRDTIRPTLRDDSYRIIDLYPKSMKVREYDGLFLFGLFPDKEDLTLNVGGVPRKFRYISSNMILVSNICFNKVGEVDISLTFKHYNRNIALESKFLRVIADIPDSPREPSLLEQLLDPKRR